MQKITCDDWSQWVTSPVTKAVMQHLTEVRNSGIEKMLNLDVQETLEQYAMHSLALRYFAEGVAECTDLENLEAILVEEETNERA